MESERKMKLLKYLYPTEKARQFICNDLNEELSLIIPNGICFSNCNNNHKIRKENLRKVQAIINDFITNNIIYKKEISHLFKIKEIEDIIEISLINYVFYLSNILPKCYGIDKFKDKRSICYAPISVIDII